MMRADAMRWGRMVAVVCAMVMAAACTGTSANAPHTPEADGGGDAVTVVASGGASDPEKVPWGDALDGLRTRVLVTRNDPLVARDPDDPEGDEILMARDESTDPPSFRVVGRMRTVPPTLVGLRLELRNETDATIVFKPPVLWSPGALIVTGPDGERAKTRVIAGDVAVVQPERIGPRKTETVREVALSAYYDLSRPGRYVVRFPETRADPPWQSLTRDVLPASNALAFDVDPEPGGAPPSGR